MTTSISLQAFSQTYFCILAHHSPFVKRFFLTFFIFCTFLKIRFTIRSPALHFSCKHKVFLIFSWRNLAQQMSENQNSDGLFSRFYRRFSHPNLNSFNCSNNSVFSVSEKLLQPAYLPASLPLCSHSFLQPVSHDRNTSSQRPSHHP